MVRWLLLGMAACLCVSVTSAAAREALAPKVAEVSCQSLMAFDPQLPRSSVKITSAIVQRISERRACVLLGRISPNVRFEIRLPVSGWNQRYLQTGCGGLCGVLAVRMPQRPCPMYMRGDFATASTDMGHEGHGMGGGEFGADPQMRIDFAYRGVHLAALVAKAVITKFYGQAPRWSYFAGCSDGGREALMEAQRYPDDFNGIAAGDPALDFLVLNSFHQTWNTKAAKAGGLNLADLHILHAAVLAECDAADGLTDGLISDPLACRFDPMTIVCKAAGQANSLPRAKAEAAHDLYEGARDPLGGKFDIGDLMPGSELAWADALIPQRMGGQLMIARIAASTLRWLAYEKPLGGSWQLSDFQFTKASLAGLMPMHGLYDATDPDLRAFARKGGRLLMWHGWSDPLISPIDSVAYSQAVHHALGAAEANKLMRLFLIPGLYHCDLGDGLASVDVLTPLMRWVEEGKAPNYLLASHNVADAWNGLGCPIYAFPATARLLEGKDPSKPTSWRKGPDMSVPAKLYDTWYGQALFRPDYEGACAATDGHLTCRPLY